MLCEEVVVGIRFSGDISCVVIKKKKGGRAIVVAIPALIILTVC